jgi:uncharacterized protein YyaL (SSP411 family)
MRSIALLFLCACASKGMVREGTPDRVNVALSRARPAAAEVKWRTWSAESFAEARGSGRLLLIDFVAGWCHWCHVMDETTYRDPEVARLISERFVAIQVDVDARPELAERYEEWGWPATVMLTPEAEELGKYRGYLSPERMKDLLEAAATAKVESSQLPEPPARLEELAAIATRTAQKLDSFYDPEQGSWGTRIKAALGANLEFELRRGDPAGRARFTFAQQRALIDPVWGGIYQYSGSSHWNDPHFEKLMTWQAPNLEAYSRGFARLHDAALRADAEQIKRYLLTHLSSPRGTFYVAQDADVNAHDPTAPFIDGHVFYARDDAGRRALGAPWIDTHVYARENGLAIAALAVLYRATGDTEALGRARRAADALLATHVKATGEVWREAGAQSTPLQLADAAAFGRALVELTRAITSASERSRYLARARLIAAALLRNFTDPSTGGLFDSTPDPDAAGAFARRQLSFSGSVTAARFLIALSRSTGEQQWRQAGLKALAAIATPRRIDAQGRTLGELLLALDEAANEGMNEGMNEPANPPAAPATNEVSAAR